MKNEVLVNYYKDQLKDLQLNEWAPTIKITSSGKSTKNMDLNKESAKVLIEWLTDNFIEDNTEGSSK